MACRYRFLPAECTAALSTDDPTAERITALINLYIIHVVFLPAIFINLTYRLRFFSADDRFMIIRYQILWQFSVIMFFREWDTFCCICFLVEQISLIYGILQNAFITLSCHNFAVRMVGTPSACSSLQSHRNLFHRDIHQKFCGRLQLPPAE